MTRILVTNDDGINAEGIRKLTESLGKIAEVYVAAPAAQQSAKSQSLTIRRPITVEEIGVDGAHKAFAVEGTPADCVMWAIPEFAAQGIEFDYLFSGINMGDNAGIAAYYSGTISAAREGALRGVKSIALSVCSHEATHFDYICNLIPRLMKMSDSVGPATIISVNAPDIPVQEVKGVRVIEAAPWGYRETYGFHETAPGEYRIGRVILPDNRSWPQIRTDNDFKYDLDCIRAGYVAISPLTSEASDRIALGKLQGLWPQDAVGEIPG